MTKAELRKELLENYGYDQEELQDKTCNQLQRMLDKERQEEEDDMYPNGRDPDAGDEDYV